MIEKPQKHLESNDDVIEKSIGAVGPWQIWMTVTACLVEFPAVWQQLSYTFLAPPAEFVCEDNSTDKCSTNCTKHIFDRSQFSETIITQWDLVCEKHYLADLSQTFVMLGVLLGNVTFGSLADRFGRRKPLLIAVLLQGIFGILTAFVPWFYVFFVLRFFLAWAIGGAMISNFVLVMEIIGIKWRPVFSILCLAPFGVGHTIIAVLSYFLRDWRHLQLSLSVPSVFLTVLYYMLFPESPRFLLTAGRSEEAISLLEKAASFNNLPTANIRHNVETYLYKLNNSDNSTADSRRGNILDLFRTPRIRLNTICMWFNWLVVGLCFFGVAYYIGRLSGDIFLNVAITGVIEIISSVLPIWFVKIWGRKYSLVSSNILAGLSLLALVFIHENLTWLKTTLAIIGMFGINFSFYTSYVYTGELFPTAVRTIGVGTSSMCARIGSMAAPHIVSLVENTYWLPPLIFGIGPLLGTLLCLKLPETLNLKLFSSVKDMEQFYWKKKTASEEAF